MKRSLVVSSVVLMLVLMAVPVSAGPGNAQGPHQKATGGVWAAAGGADLQLEFNAHGTDPVKGQVSYSATNGNWFRGEVSTCYFQDGNEAAFAGMVTDGNVTKGYFLIEVQDNGEGGQADPDFVRVRLADEEPECELSGSFPGEVYAGNLQVH